MKIESYEKNYVATKNAINVLGKIEPIVNFMREHSGEVLTCAEIGKGTYGDNYNNNSREAYYERWNNPELYLSPQKLGNILSHLVELGFVERRKIDGQPCEITHEKYIEEDANNEPLYITVTDTLGREYEIRNPNFHYSRGEWREVTETIVPKINVYVWVGEAN